MLTLWDFCLLFECSSKKMLPRESDQAMCFRHDWPFHHRSQHGVWCLGHQHRSRHVFSASFCVALSRCPVGRGARGALVTSEELSNMLWGLARLTEQMKRPLKEASQLAQAVMKESTARLSSFSSWDLDCAEGTVLRSRKLNGRYGRTTSDRR